MTGERKQPIGRTFLVGCPRSGTTLLQSMLFAHPAVFSCPETFFFVKVVNPGGRRHRLGLAAEEAPRACRAVVDLGLAQRPPGMGALPRTERAYARWFVDALDNAALRAGRRHWIEKTPAHLSRIGPISRLVPGARFIHMVRAGGPTVASLVQVTREYPEEWDGERDLETCAARWSEDIARSAQHAGQPGHCFVAYERLVSDARSVMTALCAALDLEHGADTVDRILRGYADRAVRVGGDEPWKAGTAAPVVNRNAARLKAMFDEQQRAHLDRLLEPAERSRAALPFV